MALAPDAIQRARERAAEQAYPDARDNRRIRAQAWVMTEPVPEHAPRFWRHVDKSGEHWLWTGARDKQGRGRFSMNRTSALAHRVAYELIHGHQGPGQVIQACRVKSCVRPSHLAFQATDTALADALHRFQKRSERARRARQKLAQTA